MQITDWALEILKDEKGEMKDHLVNASQMIQTNTLPMKPICQILIFRGAEHDLGSAIRESGMAFLTNQSLPSKGI